MNMDLIVNFTPTGMIPTKEMTPHVPVSVSEIVEEIKKYDCSSDYNTFGFISSQHFFM